MKTAARLLLLLGLAAALAAPVHAQEVAESLAESSAGQGPPRRSLGLGLLASPDPYRGSDAELFPIPVVVLRGERLSLVGIRLSAHLWKHNGWSLDAIAQPRFGGFDPDDSPFLEGMEEREFSIDAGLELQWQSRKWAVSVDALHDVLSRSEGFETGVSLQRRYQFGRWFLSPGIGLGWQSEKLTDYYYGVRPNEARPDRPRYTPGSALVPSIGFDAVYVFPDRRWSARVFADVELLPDSVRDSPIIEDGYGAFLALAVAYNL